uniref:Uncharacterized protein n=1 Tax=Lepeophtheirus salmonis TaxID=72036 RepID=A0A0K2T484_LEPSM
MQGGIALKQPKTLSKIFQLCCYAYSLN